MPTNYTNCISLKQALYFDLFDDIRYKWLKLVLNPTVDDFEYDIEVEIEDLPCDRPAFAIVKFTFELAKVDDVILGRTRYSHKTFTKTIEYNTSSELAMMLSDMVDSIDSEYEDLDTVSLYPHIIDPKSVIELK